jgi:gliotoxin/aspirochlorine biosynthesis peptide synthetase
MLPSDISRWMKRYCRESNISLHQLTLGVVVLALHPTLAESDIVFRAPYLNRSSAVEMKTMGLFLEPLPIRIQSPDNGPSASSTSFLQSIKQSSQAALVHAMPWMDL